MTLQDLKDNLAKETFGETSSEAQQKNTCVFCKAAITLTAQPTKENGNIYSFAGRREYQISGICETCFDNL